MQIRIQKLGKLNRFVMLCRELDRHFPPTKAYPHFFPFKQQSYTVREMNAEEESFIDDFDITKVYPLNLTPAGQRSDSLPLPCDKKDKKK